MYSNLPDALKVIVLIFVRMRILNPQVKNRPLLKSCFCRQQANEKSGKCYPYRTGNLVHYQTLKSGVLLLPKTY